VPDAQAQQTTSTAAVVGFPLVDLARPAVDRDQDQAPDLDQARDRDQAPDRIPVGLLTVCAAHGELIIGARGACPRCHHDQVMATPFPPRDGPAPARSHAQECRERARRRAAQLRPDQREAHRREDQEAMAPRREARLRPVRVRVGQPGDQASDGTALLTVPADASPLAHQVVKVVCSLATVRLHCGASIRLALEHLALGRDQLTRLLEVEGITADRKSVAAALRELCALKVLTRVGQLNPWQDRQGPAQPFHKQGAYTYTLHCITRQLGQSLPRTAASRAPAHTSATLRGERWGSRVHGCLEAAIELATVGNRNGLGHWLTCRCTDEALTEGETMKVLESYRGRLPEKHSYSAREAAATVRSRYRKLQRLKAA
jgi:hypothetical protein